MNCFIFEFLTFFSRYLWTKQSILKFLFVEALLYYIDMHSVVNLDDVMKLGGYVEYDRTVKNLN